MHHSPRFLDLVDHAKQYVPEVTLAEIKPLLNAPHLDFYLVDVREDSEWDHGAIPTAIHLGKGIIERDIETTIPDLNAKIILYCGGGYRSLLAAENLRKMGYINVYSLIGGYRGWCECKTEE